MGIAMQRQKVNIAVDYLLGLLKHLAFGNPKSSLTDSDREVIDFNPEKLLD